MEHTEKQLKTRDVQHQAGGHFAANGDHILPNLQRSDGTFLKLIRDSPRYQMEVVFYQSVFSSVIQKDRWNNNSDSWEEDQLQLRKLLPTYYGLFTTLLNGKEIQYLVLEDLTGKFKFPCVLDVKLKADVHDPNSTNQHPVFFLATKLGFLIDGITVYNKKLQCYQSLSKSVGKSLSENTVTTELTKYFNGNGPDSKAIVRSFIRKLTSVESWARSQKSYHFYRSSLLFVYDADALLSGKNIASFDQVTDVRLIDFAKVHPSEDTDRELVSSLQHLRTVFESLLV